MRPLLILGSALLLASCASPEHRMLRSLPSSGTWTEKCPSCKETEHVFGFTFDDDDYGLIADLAAALQVAPKVHWRAPTGPTPSCSSTYSKDISFEYIKEGMPSLRRETFEDFLRRNNPVPVHRLPEWRSDNGKQVTVEFHKLPASNAQYLSRGGFSRDGKQAMIYEGESGFIYLLERSSDGWQVKGRTVMWIT